MEENKAPVEGREGEWVLYEKHEQEKPMSFFEKVVDKANKFKLWILGFGTAGLVVWWVVKILVCIFGGICLL